MAEKLVIRNIGLLLSGALENPVLDADTVVAEDGRIAAFGKEADCNIAGADAVVDAKGVALAPGLIDSHVHPVRSATGRRGRTSSTGSTPRCMAG